MAISIQSSRENADDKTVFFTIDMMVKIISGTLTFQKTLTHKII